MGADNRFAPGVVVAGQYQIRRLLGAGGMGEVYAARGPRGEKVALKVLHERAARDADLVARFEREAKIAEKIRSPFVAGIVGSGRERDGTCWIAFERLEGEGLDERLRREQYLAFSEVFPIVEDSLQGLRDAHAARVVHRDIKPANLFIERLAGAGGEDAERTRILDFGVSKVRAADDRKSEPSLTAIDATLGSFAYMAPEQVRGSARVDERADLYALGAVAFRALTGRLPFEGTNALTLIALKLDRDPPSLTATTGDTWPAAVERFVSSILARDRDRRFRSAEETLSEWRALGATMGDTRFSISRPVESEPYPVDDRTEVTVDADDVALGFRR